MITLNSFFKTVRKYLSENDINENIGRDILLSLITEYIPNNSLYNQTIILKVHVEDNVLDVYSILNEFDKRIAKINYIEVNNREMYEKIVNLNKTFNNSFDIQLDEYFIAISKNISDLSNSINLLNDNSSNIKIESIFKYVNENTLVRGERFRTIRALSNDIKIFHKKRYLNKSVIINYLDDYVYLLRETDDDLIVNFQLNYIKNELILNILNIKSLVQNNNEIDIPYLYMQDCFYTTRLEYLKYFRDIEPITIDYLNSSIKKNYYDEKNRMFLTKIYLESNLSKHRKYIHSIFNENTTIFK